MGKSDKDHSRSDVRERVTDANKVPLGRPAYFSGSKPGVSSLLKPSYLKSDDVSSPSSASAAVGHFNMFSQSSTHSSHSSMGDSGPSSASALSKYMMGDYSRPNYDRPNMPKPNLDRPNMTDHTHSAMHSLYSGMNNQQMSSYTPVSTKSTYKRESGDSNDGYGNGGAGGDHGDDERGRERKRKRRSRWMGGTDEKAVIPGMPTILPSDLPPDQQEAYIAQLQIEELTRKLRSGDLGIAPNPEDRSPSPEPIYGTDGKRLNTREYRTRKKLEEERHKLIQRLLKLNPDYKPPADYRAPIVKIVDRVPIPQEEHPEINFVGLLIGPRGNTLKGLEKDTGAKIIIRGKGSVKEGKVGGKAGHPLPGEDEPLHAYVTSNNPDSVKKACEKIKEIIRQGIDMPESQNDLRKNQLRELALLNGTLREGEGPKCSNCGATSHRTWHCPDKPNVTNNVICTVCGGAGHIGRDCRFKRPGAGGPPVTNMNEKAKIDEEYMSLMAELGEAPPKDDSRPSARPKLHSGGHNLFEKHSAPKAIMAQPSGSTSPGHSSASAPAQQPAVSSGSVPPPPPGGGSATSFMQGWSSSAQPPPPGDLGKVPPPAIPPSWGYMPGYPPPMGAQQWAPWSAPPPVPPPPSAQPPPPGMFWHGGNPPPPPPPPADGSQPPPPPT